MWCQSLEISKRLAGLEVTGLEERAGRAGRTGVGSRCRTAGALGTGLGRGGAWEEAGTLSEHPQGQGRQGRPLAERQAEVHPQDPHREGVLRKHPGGHGGVGKAGVGITPAGLGSGEA